MAFTKKIKRFSFPNPKLLIINVNIDKRIDYIIIISCTIIDTATPSATTTPSASATIALILINDNIINSFILMLTIRISYLGLDRQ